MASFSSFMATFVIFSKILAQSEAASISSSRNSGLVWITDELPLVKNIPNQDSIHTTFENTAETLLHILDEMQSFVDVLPADDPNTGNDQSYQPGPPCAANANGDSNKQREEMKQQYLEYYKQRILKFTQWDEYPSPIKSVENSSIVRTQQLEPLNQIVKKVEERRSLPEFEGNQKMVSLYPDCDNSNIWGTGNTIDFSFDLSFSTPSPQIVINVTSAFVRMYKKPLNMNIAEAMQLAPNRNISFLAVFYKNPHNRKDPTKKGVKLGEHTYRVEEERWTEWDVKRAIAAGFNNTLKYNGVIIKLADDQIHLPAREFFSMPKNCSHITDWPTLTPAILRNSTHDGMRKDLPFIDMIVLELPRRDVDFAKKEEEFLNGVKKMKQQIDEGIAITKSNTEHRIRHRKNRESELNV